MELLSTLVNQQVQDYYGKSSGLNQGFSSARALELKIVKYEEEEVVNYTQCVFPGTSNIYVDCCTDSSYKICTIIAAMFFVVFAAYIVIFGYIVNKNPWIKRHGLYINVFVFQLMVIIMRGLYYSFFGRSKNESVNTYVAFRTAPIVVSLISMTSYTLHLVILLHRHGTDGTQNSKRNYQIKMHFVFWGIFLVYIALWLLVWRVSVSFEALSAMDGVLSVFYAVFLIIQVQLVRKLYAVLKIKMPPVAEAAQCHIFLMKFILVLHLGLRIVMNSMSDSSNKEQATTGQQISWIYILFGDAITELLSAFGMIILITLTFKFDSMAIQYNQQSCKYFKQSELYIEKYAAMNPDNDQEEELVSVKKKPGVKSTKKPVDDEYDDEEDSHDNKRQYRK
ncbi:UNKNOWN [Stylonychia lemnae]|uniref:Uncharacterized protein n=1 Tax=Stylonychia lemnae TaxID=5949 RepID=A0A078A656_STYLE|nr:UNKNOWN [Stylonychia lemnae]|eukprot:CDW77045.1 UNKNOWN [Stylonychia lemnae]